MATAKNKITRSVSPGSIFESAQAVLDSTISYNQGDLLSYDSSGKKILIPSAEGDGATFLGVARETVVNGQIKNPFTGTEVAVGSAIPDSPGPQYGVIAKAFLKPSDSLSPGDLVYLNPAAGTQHVQASGTKAVGVYQGAAVTGGPTSALTEIEVLFGHRYPGDVLAF